MRLVTTHIRVGLRTAYALALRLWLTCRIGENSAGYFCQGGTLIASFRCHCGNLLGLGMNLQAERINRLHRKVSTCKLRIPDYFSQVFIRDMGTLPVCSQGLTSQHSYLHKQCDLACYCQLTQQAATAQLSIVRLPPATS